MGLLVMIPPQVIRRLLESCTSVKTKWPSTHAAVRLQCPWLSRLNLTNVDDESGGRTVQPGRPLDKKYNLVALAGAFQKSTTSRQ